MDLTVYEAQFPKKRIGKHNDGGYVIVALPTEYDLLLSGGIETDTSFEDEFLEIYNVNCVAFDASITKCPSVHPRFTWIPKYVGTRNTDNLDNLHSYLESHSNIFLKMDIEGAEIPWLETLSEKHMNSLAQIVMEFHNPFSNRETLVMQKIQKTHVLFHLHANNYGGMRGNIPRVFECTYVNRKFVTYPVRPNQRPNPDPSYDEPNIPSYRDLDLNFRPYVDKPSPKRWSVNNFRYMFV